MHNRKHLILFGSSIHPIHIGHIEILELLVKQNPDAEVWLLPVYNYPDSNINPWKPSGDTFNDRIELAEMMIAEYKLEERVKVSKIERDAHFKKLEKATDNQNPRVTTFDLLNHLRETLIANKEDVDISLAVGSDVYNDLIAGRWGEEGAAVIGHCKSIICNIRQGYQAGATADFMHRMFNYKKKIAKRNAEGDLIPFTKKIDFKIDDASSTKIRTWIAEGMPSEDARAKYISPAVAERIREKGWYGYPSKSAIFHMTQA